MDRWAGKWALVTGASAGIGREIAKQLAARGVHLVLTARRRERLDEAADELRRSHNVSVEVFPADLAQSGEPDAIFAFTQGKRIAVDLLINNAGFGAYGEFHTVPLPRLLGMVQVNCTAIIHLTHLFLAPMIERRRGDILIVASTAAFQAVPFITTYAATKSFDLLFAEGLAEEVRRFGVNVCALCPGPTVTEFHDLAGSPQRASSVREPAERVAHVGLEALAAGKSYVISGRKNYAQTHLQRLVPRGLVTRAAALLYSRKHK